MEISDTANTSEGSQQLFYRVSRFLIGGVILRTQLLGGWLAVINN